MTGREPSFVLYEAGWEHSIACLVHVAGKLSLLAHSVDGRQASAAGAA